MILLGLGSGIGRKDWEIVGPIVTVLSDSLIARRRLPPRVPWGLGSMGARDYETGSALAIVTNLYGGALSCLQK